MATLYDFSVKNQQSEAISLREYAGKVVLLVNTATKCGFTPQYKELEELYAHFSREDFEILDFPCNQFAGQAPGTDEEINTFCSLTYGTTFPRFAKIDVNGKSAEPLYVWLRQQKTKDEGNEAIEFMEKIRTLNPFNEPGKILWNFTKFLVDRQGNVVHRYSPTVKPSQLRERIAEELAK